MRSAGGEKGKKAGVSSSSSSSAEDSAPSGILLFEVEGNRGRWEKAWPWLVDGSSAEDEDADEDEDSIADGERGGGASWAGMRDSRVSASTERRCCLGLAPIVLCMIEEERGTKVMVFVEAVRE